VGGEDEGAFGGGGEGLDWREVEGEGGWSTARFQLGENRGLSMYVRA
jgi:hypothetical protein